MPYTLNQAANVMAIAEREWGVAQTIQFTPFTSCIGVLAKVKGQIQVIGVHLGLYDGQSNPFTAEVVTLIKSVLTNRNYDPATVIIIGQIAVWEKSAAVPYQTLLTTLSPVNTYPLANGTYGATINTDGQIELTYV